MTTHHFVDTVRIHVKAGSGGDGIVSFLSEKWMEFGGPAGGDGGRGGSIYLVAEENMTTLLDLKMRPSWTADDGKKGGKKNMSGKGGEDVFLKVPVGTTVIDHRTGVELGDLTQPDQVFLVARGGDGGLGNQHFATATNKAPKRCTPGRAGEEKNILLELKVIADAGLVGLPNAGKSTLLSRITSANPKIAPYPFTTLHPNLGVFLASDFQSRVTIADIPGLIEGAHSGAGLGDRFLRHVERTKVLVHLVAPEAGETAEGELTSADVDPETLLYAYDLVRAELNQYSQKLVNKPFIVCVSKIDLMSDEELEAVMAAFRARGIEPLPISSSEDRNLEVLKLRIEAEVLAQRAAEQPGPVAPSPLDLDEPATDESTPEETKE